MNLSLTWAGWREPARTHFHGVMVSLVVAMAAMSLAEHYGASALLFALLLGMAMNFLSAEGRCVPGIQFSASTLLRIGVALLGVRITLAQISALGAWPIAMVVGSVALTIGFGVLLARALGYRNRFGVLTGGAVAICGASAAMAIAAVMPAHADDKVKERATIFTVIGVSTLSTLAMVLYPMIVGLLGLAQEHAGIFLGGTIHDVAQVVGAGYSMGKETGDVGDDRQAAARGDAAAGDPGDHAVVSQACIWPGRRAQASRRCCHGSSSPLRCWWPSTAPG
jgi:uncharacterized integral membrane protein (TIGR00698 family)